MEPNQAPEPMGSAGHGGGEGAGREGGSRSFLGLLTLGIRHWRVLLGLPLGAFVAAVALSFMVEKEFTSSSRFIPEKRNELSGELAGMAAQLGLPIGGGESGESLDFYEQLLGSEELLRAAVLTEYGVPLDGDTLRGTLLELYDIDGDTHEERLKAATDRLGEEDITITPYRAAEVLLLRVRAPWPELAESINRRLLTLVNDFNLERRQSTASRERQFLEARVAQAETDLRDAESELEAFLQSNRRYSESPETAFRYNRLQRNVDFLRQIHTSMAQALEQARVEAIRNTPVVTVIDRPEGTARQTAPNPLVNGVLGLLLGGALAVSIVVGGTLLRGARRSHPRDYAELRQALREAFAGLRLRGRSRRRGGAGAVGGRGGRAARGEERPSETASGVGETVAAAPLDRP